MTDLIQEIEKAIEDKSEEYTKISGAHGAVAKNFVRNDFLAGANLVLPLLKKAIEQRDVFYNKHHNRTLYSDASVEKMNNALNIELLKLLGLNHE